MLNPPPRAMLSPMEIAVTIDSEILDKAMQIANATGDANGHTQRELVEKSFSSLLCKTGWARRGNTGEITMGRQPTIESEKTITV